MYARYPLWGSVKLPLHFKSMYFEEFRARVRVRVRVIEKEQKSELRVSRRCIEVERER